MTTESFVAFALCCDNCEPDHLNQCVECGALTCYKCDPVCSCAEPPLPLEADHKSDNSIAA